MTQNKRRKIVHIINTLERGGAEMSLLRMLPLLNDEIESVFITLKQKGSLTGQFQNHGIRVITLAQKSAFDFYSLKKLRKILRELSPDLVITHLLYPDIVGRFFIQFFLPCKVISSIVTTYNSSRYFIARLFERFTHPICAGYMANAHAVKQAYVEKFKVPENKITVIQTGMDTNFFKTLEPKDSLRQELGIKPGDTVIICVANLHPNKGHAYLLEAFEKAYKQNHPIKLLIVGDGIEKENLKRQTIDYNSKNSILFLGQRPDVPDLLALSDIFALATFFEGMCNAIMEAMARGIPIITTDITENRELVTNGKTGLLCPLRDSNSLAQALTRLINDSELRIVMSNNAAEEMEEKYSLHIIASRWKNFFVSHSIKK